MTILQKCKELEATISADKKQVDELKLENESLRKQIEEYKNTSAVSVEDFNAAKADHEVTKKECETLKSYNDELVKKNEELNAKMTNFEKAVSDRLVELTASQGVAPVAVATVADPASTSNSDVVSQYTNIKDPAKQRAFWEEHREELTEALKNR